MRIMIVGAEGFVGRFLLGHFTAAGDTVTPIGRSSPLPGAAVDVVIDCNGDARRFWANENPVESYHANVAATIERMTTLNCRRYVYLSTIDVYGDARNDPAANTEDAPISLNGLETYGFQKHLSEQIIGHHMPGSLILRVGTLIGPGLRKNPVHDALNGLAIRQTPESTLSLITLGKLADAVDRLLTADAAGTFNVTAAASVDVATMLRRTAEALGHAATAPTFHPALLSTAYDISVAKLSRFMDLPDSDSMLVDYLSGPR